jgi:predicted  nucleic acid-binding Zn-ribbon protein
VYSDLKTLIDLQRLDQEIAELSSRIDTFPNQIQTIEKQLNDFIHAHEERQHHLSSNQKERRDMEGEIQVIRQKISKHKDQLYLVKTNEQYRAMLKEIEGEEANIRSIEDRILEKMIESEELQMLVTEAAGRLDSEKARVAKEKAELEAAANASREERDHSVQERRELAAKLNEDILAHYERVRKGRGGLALAEVRQGKCMGCNVMLRPQLYYDVRAGEGLYECENCARILYSHERLSASADTETEAGGPQALAPN